MRAMRISIAPFGCHWLISRRVAPSSTQRGWWNCYNLTRRTIRRASNMLILREDDVRQVLTMPEAIDALAVAFRDWTEGHAQNIPRQRIVMREAGGVLHVLP